MTEAREHLERAYQESAGDEKAKNLLGLAYFKLGDFERAAEVRVVGKGERERPHAAVNLGLVSEGHQLTPRRGVRGRGAAPAGHLKAHDYLALPAQARGVAGRARELP